MNLPSTSLLLTDLYQLTMLQGYVEHGMEEQATFEFFVRKLPPARNFLLAAGLEQALCFLEDLRFTSEELEWLSGCGLFRPSLVDYLEQLQFTGDVHAIPEGTVCFPDEPIVRITAPLPQAQLVETRLINLLHFQTLIASKAARSVLVAPGKLLVDFGLRRTHGAEAGLLAARASYLAGFSGTSAVQAAPLFGIPIYGTMAHSYIQAHEDEAAAFERFAYANPDNVVFLIDTYDTEAGAAKVVSLATRLRQRGIPINGVRLDSGDLGDHARKVRRILDEGRLTDTTIFASGNLDESIVQQLVATHAPIDGFGIGTRMDVSADAPYLDCAYKLEAYGGKARRKRSEGKATWPGCKQVFRRYGPDGRMRGDILTLEDDPQEGEPLIQPVMRAGKRLHAPASLTALRERARTQLARLPDGLRTLEKGPDYPVQVSPALRDLAKAVDEHRL